MTLLNKNAARQFDYEWHALSCVNRQQIPSNILPWVSTPDSLTAKLQQAGSFKVEVISDYIGLPTQRERNRLNLHAREQARIRTVLLYCNHHVVIYGRSIIPLRSLRGHWRCLSKLADKPLGGYLFKNKQLSRSPIEVTQLPAGLMQNTEESLWARRSIFYGYGPGILVNEAFYPTIGQL
ncbi:chorismate--pyruvate lyase family protein [Marinomonas mediterranea]|jgi:4-hydroxybenzoate synthetase (chorismate lyase)|uniref:Probable chorismate pyruvate-lyase n=1 Tax=Marinomonas mediterranea (strain ATCC 700492 / JCM 21426 / NBRC 103028 / MMB-1) TaxID=717774 RepID=F2K0Z1_MARM1|nr:chorismate lyase [Marinomonas mediterranea]ADZ93340.1 Chorismate--pyruvate lyase [Marinomonas mediterranea MMB-1]WCN11229.1 chorismate lyase [Marinomonas mediterranea]WCN15291.1 chorismate lyase [Marinomonas mediterranea]WCN19336.1 chorismate lyase [Marinomonas mediterranea MMB-1]